MKSLLFALGWFCLFANGAGAAESLQLQPKDHIALIGNGLPDRFQHSGWLETYLHAQFPKHELVFRNLAVAGDEVSVRPRSENFGSPEDWLKKVQADVIFAFFGFNESFQGEAGLAKWRADLEKFVKETKDYSGKGRARVVLFSPIAAEKHTDPNFADPTALNKNLQAYTAAMREVARAEGVLFVDLFEPSQALYRQAAARSQNLTINGFHLADAGDRLVAEVIFKQLFGTDVPKLRNSALEKLRQAVNEKNEQWHARYRTIDGNNIYGGRSALAYQPEKGSFISDRTPATPYVSNFKVMQEEMSQRDVMTANRDRQVWARAQGRDLKVKDDNLPEVTRVQTNIKGPNPDQSFRFLDATEAIGKMKVHAGLKVNLFASEKEFPELSKPVQMAWDTKGRLWVAVWPNYPVRTPDSEVGDSLLVFEDRNGDGKADKCTHFADDLNGPTGFQFYRDGVLLMQAPDVWFLRDTNGDGKADWKERVLMGMSSADSHHTANSICHEPGGAIYLSDGVFHRTQVETAAGPARNNDGAIFRYEPRTARFETHVAYDFANPHGRVFDYWGNDLVTDGTGNNTYFGPAFSGHIDYPQKHRNLQQFWKRPSRPCAATTILTSRHFPDEFQGNFLNCNVIGFQGIYRVKITEDGSGLEGQTQEDLVSSEDPNFRPVAVNVGPDGAVYFADWQNPIIGHMQHHLRDPNRDHEHGRIYRITCQGRPLLKSPAIEGRSIPALLELLKEPENQVREWAKIELGKRDTKQVIAAVKKWAAGLDVNEPNGPHHLLEALWVHQWHNVVDAELLQRVLQSSEPRARAAAARVMIYWRDRLPDALDRFARLAQDQHPRVRLEAVRAASFFPKLQAVDTALLALKQPTDYYLDYVLGETLRQLKPWWRQALESGQPVAENNPAGRTYLLQTVATAELQKLPRSPMVLAAILSRADALDADRMVALGELAQARSTNLAATLIRELQAAVNAPQKPDRPRGPGGGAVEALAGLLPYQSGPDLRPFRAYVESLTSSQLSADLRRNGWAALVITDEGFDGAWTRAAKDNPVLADLLDGIPRITDSGVRAKAYDKVLPLLTTSDSEAVRAAAIRALVSMNHEPETVFTSLTELITKGRSVQPAARGIAGLPRAAWPRQQAEPAAKGLVAWARKVPAGERTAQEYCEIVQLGSDLAGLLPAEQGRALRQDLKELRVASFVIRAVREQMRYDMPRLVVEAGKPFEILFENADFMPHNLVLVKPKTDEKIGLAAAAMKVDELDNEGRAYVPRSSDVVAATRMLQSGQRQTLKLTAPSDESESVYLCTFPGHYQVMRGQWVVTRDVEAYLQAHPEAPLPPPAAAGGSEEHAHGHSK